MRIDGKQVAEEVFQQLLQEREELGPLTLGMVLAGGDAASRSFVSIKERLAGRLRVEVLRKELPVGATTAEAVAAVEELANVSNGMVVQLPLAEGITIDEVLAAIPAELDVDVLRPAPPRAPLRAPVAEAVREVFARAGVSVLDKRAVVVGEGRLVGAPCTELLKELGAKVEVISLERGSLSLLKDMDIVILGAGQPGLIKPEMLKEGVVLIDAGTSEADKRIVGDADPRCEEVASVFTPVPGGIGPIAVVMLYKNLLTLAKIKSPRS